MRTSKSWIRRIVGVVSIAGGFSGLVNTMVAAAQFTTASSFVLGGVFALLYGGGAWLGMRLLEQDDGSIRWLKMFYWIQVPALQTAAISYFFAALASITVMYRFEFPIDVVYAGTGGFIFAMWNGQLESAVGLNLVPFVCLALLHFLEQARSRHPTQN